MFAGVNTSTGCVATPAVTAPVSGQSVVYSAVQVRAARLRVVLDDDLGRSTPVEIMRIAESTPIT